MLLQCVDGYIVTEAIKKNTFSETLRARRISDKLHVVIKRFASRLGIHINTLMSYVPASWSIQHPHFLHNLDVLFLHDFRRPLGSGAVRRAGKYEVMTVVVVRQETSLYRVLHIKNVQWKNSREKWRKYISWMGKLRGQARVRPIDKMDEVCTNADD